MRKIILATIVGGLFSFTNVYDYTSVATLTIENLSVNGTNKGCTYQLEKITDATPASPAEKAKKTEDDD